MSYCDLHLHTLHSDGSDSPERVVERAKAAGIGAMALTDHDTLAGVGEAREISASFAGVEVHILGYGVDCEEEALATALAALREGRANRGRAILEKLDGLGITVDGEALLKNHGANLGRMHVAAALRAAGHVRVLQEAFDQYLNPGCPAFVAKETLDAESAIGAIHQAGGLAFLAHPGLQKRVNRLVQELLALPFDGIEAYHISHSAAQTKTFLSLAARHQILVSGGSDCHGTIKGRIEMGNVKTPMAVYEKLVAAL